MWTDDRPLRVFVSHAAVEDVGDLIRALRGFGHVVDVPEGVSGWLSFPHAAVEAIRAADLVLAVLDGASADVLIQIGVALGVRTPVLLLSTSTTLRPRGLAALPRANRVNLEALDDMIRRTAATESTSVDRKRVGHAALSNDTAAELRTALESKETDERAFEELVVRLFEHAGAQVLRRPIESPGAAPLAGPDLVVWHEDLHAGFGLPLPVEVLPTLWPDAMWQQLHRTLILSGARSLLAVTRFDYPPLASVDAEGRTIVVVSAVDLMHHLAELPLGEAFGLLRTQAILTGAER